jgi:hypothetical protein
VNCAAVTTGEEIALPYPWIFDVESDPKELWNVNVSSNWVGQAAMPYFVKYQRSLKDAPNIPPGAAGPVDKGNGPDSDLSVDVIMKQVDPDKCKTMRVL